MNDTDTDPDATPGGPVLPETVRHLANGEAALMLLESLFFVLIERRLLTVEDLVAAVEAAIATKRQMVEEHVHPQVAAVAAGVLSTMANSFAASDPVSNRERDGN